MCVCFMGVPVLCVYVCVWEGHQSGFLAVSARFFPYDSAAVVQSMESSRRIRTLRFVFGVVVHSPASLPFQENWKRNSA